MKNGSISSKTGITIMQFKNQIDNSYPAKNTKKYYC